MGGLRRAEGRVRTRLERPLVQILVIVATIQVPRLKAEVGKGFARSAMRCESVGPKWALNKSVNPRKGSELIFSHQNVSPF